MFLDNLNNYLKAVHWRRKDLANTTGLAPETISRWNKTDRFRPSRESLIKIRDVLNIELARQGKKADVTIDKLISEGD